MLKFTSKQQQVFELEVEGELELYQQEYERDEHEIKSKYFLKRMDLVLQKYINLALTKPDANRILILKHFTALFLQFCKSMNTSLFSISYIKYMAVNPELPSAESGFVKEYQSEVRGMLSEFAEIRLEWNNDSFYKYVDFTIELIRNGGWEGRRPSNTPTLTLLFIQSVQEIALE